MRDTNNVVDLFDRIARKQVGKRSALQPIRGLRPVSCLSAKPESLRSAIGDIVKTDNDACRCRLISFFPSLQFLARPACLLLILTVLFCRINFVHLVWENLYTIKRRTNTESDFHFNLAEQTHTKTDNTS